MEETLSTVEGYSVTVTYAVDGEEAEEGAKNVEVTADESKDKTVEVTDEYTRDIGKLIIEKTFNGDLTEEEKKGDLTFKVVDETTGETVGEYTIGEDFDKITDEEGNEKYVLELDVPAGDTYSVEETIKDVTGYTVTVK